MYDVGKLKTVADCRTVMERALQRDMTAVYQAAFRRMCEIAGSEQDDPADPLVRGFHSMLAAYEQLLTEKNGRTTPASRTRQKLRNKGVYQCLIDWTEGTAETDGFKLLIEAGMPELTGEYLVASHPDRFPSHVVALAGERLSRHGVRLP